MPEQRKKKPVGVFELLEHIVRFMVAMDHTQSHKWIIENSHAYTGDEWRARGEEMGNKAFLVITSEATDWIELLNGSMFDRDLSKAEHAEMVRRYEEWTRLIESLGYHFEVGFAWSVHFYPDRDAR